ncbi:nudix hydrolase 10-like isoform X2 [Coffea eugenioides]|uniref:nudix hydrolase 10-like isoform X2 n=1 Tax=Coffea eugenioides TaxID=49369 RepID=UPI000F6127E3|nr:nudix hydrolase 10-like isoform X2 [Coffea eugenioides]
MSVMQYSTMVKRQKTYENEVHHVELLEGIEDTCGGIVVDMIKPMEPGNFIIALRASISQWKEQEGFQYHHAEPGYLMLVNWLPVSAPRLPVNASHRVGIGALVVNHDQEVLVVQEKKGKLKNNGVWKLPTGVVNEGEDISAAAIREVKEETGIETRFLEVLAFRQSHKAFFEKSDLFFVCKMQPLSFDVQKQDSEIEAAKWMPLEEYAAQPFVQNNESFNLVSKICLAKENDRYTGFSSLPTITAFSAKEIYLYFNHQYLSKIIVPTR